MKTRLSINRIKTLTFCIIVLCVMQGFKSKQIVASFPSPLDNTIIAFYYDFSSTGIYQNNQIASETTRILSSRIEKYNPAISAEKSYNFLSSLFSQTDLRPEQIYFYMSQDKNFVFAIHGNFPWQRWGKIYPKDTVVNRVDGFSVSVPANFVQGERLSINVSSNMLIICPEDIAGNVMSAISSDINKKHISFPVFQKMILQKPVIAFETSIEKIIQTIKTRSIALEIPHFLDNIAHLRLIAHKKISKLQLSVKNENQEAKISDKLQEALNSYVSDVSTITANIKNSSVYFSAKPSDRIANKISYDIGGLLLHFMTKINSSNSIVLSKNKKGSNINDDLTFSNEQKANKKLSESNNN